MTAQKRRSDGYDAVLLVSFGGPERPEDVVPFLENVLRGTNVSRSRFLEVADHYELFGGVSPAGAENRALLAALLAELNAHGPRLPLYWGNRHWHPLLADTLRQMADDGVCRAMAWVTSAFGSYPGCRQYSEAIEQARQQVGDHAPRVDKLRLYHNHPGFIEAVADRLRTALDEIPAVRRSAARILYSAHSIPEAMARTCPYEEQLREACRLVSEQTGRHEWELVYQSRSGAPAEPWLGPDVNERLGALGRQVAVRDVVVVPIGFVHENMETVYDLDVAARVVCEQSGLNMVRAAVAGCHPRLVTMIRELVEERLDPSAPRLALGEQGPWPDVCPADCCRIA
jgi:ferrochelatase